MMRNLGIIQARMSSTRLPGKVMEVVNGEPMIKWQIERTRKSVLQQIVVATSSDASDDHLAEYVFSLGVDVFRGSITNVFSRFSEVVIEHQPNYFLRLTADCPLVMPEIIDSMVHVFEDKELDYLSNTNPPTFPDGLDVEVISSTAFQKLDIEKMKSYESEHVTPGIYNHPNKFRIANYKSNTDKSEFRWTVDYPEDLVFVRSVYEYFKGRETEFTYSELLSAVEDGKIENNRKPSNYRNISFTKQASEDESV